MVLSAQEFINETYADKIGTTVEENGVTSWNVMYALTRALQYELGITALSDNFGPTTLSTLQSRYPVLDASTIPSENFCRIIQSGLYCKGYDGGAIDGAYNSRVQAAVTQLKDDIGVLTVYPGDGLTPKVFKALLNMDPYTITGDGSNTIRQIQRWLNGSFVSRQDFFAIPCDGNNSRDVAKSMLFAIQYTLGMADGVANGVFGPGTQSGLRDHELTAGSTGIWVQLFSAAMVLNQQAAGFVDSYTTELASQVSSFQGFVKLPVTGTANFSTWAALLVSYGDQGRAGAACDGVTTVTNERAQTLKAAGITHVGRYLLRISTTSLPEKEIQPGELNTIAANGLRCFPIYQTYGRDASGYSYAAGRSDGQAAANAALDHGFRAGTRIFFAVDFDAYDDEVTSNVLPHFTGIQDALSDDGSRFEIGVYGPRNVCSRVSQAGHSTASFVSDMSSGYSGNLGYPMPADWAYDQFVTRDLGTGDAGINVDVDVVSGVDNGQSDFDPPRLGMIDTRLAPGLWTSMDTDVGKYMESIGYPLDGGEKDYQHWKCFQSAVTDHDDKITELSARYGMRKALIQTSAYWEMRHVGPEDDAKDLATIGQYDLLGTFSDSSTGIAQCRGTTAAWAWNYCVSNGYASGDLIDTSSDAQLYGIWRQIHDSEEFALETVCMVHLWDSQGKPGGDHDETPLRPMSVDYTQYEISEVLRRYQGYGAQAEADNVFRMGLYQVMDKYDGISRNQ